MNEGGINQYLWVDHGSLLDWHRDTGTWGAKGFDSGKHILGTESHGFIKIKGAHILDEGWSFKG